MNDQYRMSQGVSEEGVSAEGLEKLHEIEAQANSKRAEEREKYSRSYKDVLWIDDRDNNDSGAEELDWMKELLAPECDPECVMQIEQVRSFRKAVDLIINKTSQYDFVIFDIDLETSFEGISKEEEVELEKTFRKHHIDYSFDEDKKENHRYSGYSLFKLLLALGYPFDRILIFSGHSDKENAREKINGNQAGGFLIDNIVVEKNEKINIENYFRSPQNDYYRVRRLVYQACDHWEDKLDGIQTEDIEFNKVYFKDQEPIDKNTFEDMLECVKRMFPVVRPNNPEELYYLAMREASQFHEGRAKIEKIGNDERCQYHSMIRYFRNWSAHNKISEHDLTPQQFALLFCITLKTYFCDKSSFNTPETYEKLLGISDYRV